MSLINTLTDWPYLSIVSCNELICKHVSNTYFQISIHESEITTTTGGLISCDFSYNFTVDMLISMPSVAERQENVNEKVIVDK